MEMSLCCSWYHVVASCRVTMRSVGGVTPRQGGALTGEGRGCAGLGKAGVGCCRAVRVRWAGDGEHDRPVLASVPSRAVFVRWLGEAEAAACAGCGGTEGLDSRLPWCGERGSTSMATPCTADMGGGWGSSPEVPVRLG